MPVYKVANRANDVQFWLQTGGARIAIFVVEKVLQTEISDMELVSCIDFSRKPPFGYIEHRNGLLTEIPWDFDSRDSNEHK